MVTGYSVQTVFWIKDKVCVVCQKHLDAEMHWNILGYVEDKNERKTSAQVEWCCKSANIIKMQICFTDHMPFNCHNLYFLSGAEGLWSLLHQKDAEEKEDKGEFYN